MEFILGLFLSPFIWIGLFVAALMFDNADRGGWATFVSLLLVAGLYFGLQPSWQVVLIVAACYVPIGLVWSFWRFKRYVRSRVEVFNAEYQNTKPIAAAIEFAKKRLEPGNNKAKIFYWVSWWPVSFIESVIGDIFDRIRMLITHVFHSVYERIFKSETDKLIG